MESKRFTEIESSRTPSAQNLLVILILQAAQRHATTSLTNYKTESVLLHHGVLENPRIVRERQQLQQDVRRRR